MARANATITVHANGALVASGSADSEGAFSIEVELAVGDRVFVNDGASSNMLLVQ